MSNLPKSWKKEKLSDIINLIHGYQFRTNDFTENGIAIIKIGNVNGRTLDLSGLSYISKDRFEEFKQYELNEGDIVMSLTGNIGRVVEVSNLPLKVLQNYRVGKFEAINSNVVFKKYIKFLLSSSIVLDRLETLSNQSAQANFGKQDMDKIFVPLPPLEEQKKIADILSIVDKKIAFVEENINATEELKKGLMQKLLTEGIGHTEFKDSELGRIPESWEIKTLSKICNKIVDKNKDLFYTNVLTNSANLGIISQNEYFDREIVTEKNLVNYFIVNKFDYIYNPRVSINAPCGPINQCKKYENGIVSPLYTVFRIEKDSINNDYLEFYFLSNHWNKYIKDNSNTGARHDRMSISDKLFFSMPIFIPPLEEQKQIAEILSTVDKKLENLKEKKQSFEELKKGLMQKLLTGEVRV